MNRTARPGFYLCASDHGVVETPINVPHIRCRVAAGCPACEAREAAAREAAAKRTAWEAERRAERAELDAEYARWLASPERAALMDRVLP